jgi:hypothetical protein
LDVFTILTECDRPRKYWSDLKSKLKKEGGKSCAVFIAFRILGIKKNLAIASTIP